MSHRVLIIDDEAGIRQALKQVLEYEGMDVKVASSGGEGTAWRWLGLSEMPRGWCGMRDVSVGLAELGQRQNAGRYETDRRAATRWD